MGDTRTGARTGRGAKRPIRRRAVGTRERILSHLAAVGAIADGTGMASTRLAEAVGYPGSSVAFAQLLSGMERDGLIVREVRGKRTYRITLPEGQKTGAMGDGAVGDGAGDGAGAAAGAQLAASGAGEEDLAGAVAGSAGASGGFDYDELARRLLVQLLRKLASASGASADLATIDVPAALAEHVEDRGTDEGRAVPGPGETGEDWRGEREAAAERIAREKTAALLATVAGLERELANAWTRQGTLTAENARLREQLSQAQRDLARERTRRESLPGGLNQAEVVVLERLLDENERPA